MMNSKKSDTPYITMPHWPKLLYEGRNGEPLAKTKALLAKLGNPQNKLPPVVHVAGTNGKGSTIAFFRAMCEAAGLKVHVYTQPHLHRFNERITIASREIDDTQLFEIIEATRIAAGDDNYSFFEGTTAAAFLAFSKTPADIVLLETGCGGRFDPTNVVEKPALTIITTISYDHIGILGDSLEQIAWHKAGIMRPDVPCVMSFQAPEVQETLMKQCQIIGALPCTYGLHWRIQKTQSGMQYSTAEGTVDFPAPNLLGPHQYINAANAITASTIVDVGLNQDHVNKGLTRAVWPGRIEHITTGEHAANLPEGWELWVDGGHNIAAGHALAAHIDTDWKDKPTYVIFGTTQGKDALGMLAPLASQVTDFMVIPVASEPQSYSADVLLDMLQPIGCPVTGAENIEDAIEKLTQKHKEPARIIIFGSMYLRVLAV